MNHFEKPAPEAIRQVRADNPEMRERDLARQYAISEADLVAAYCGLNVVRVEPRVADLLRGLEAVGEVMALTRNESAVHEKIGVYQNVSVGKHNATVLGDDIDLRIFPGVWKHGFAVEKRDGDDVRRSLQFFDEAGDAVHKIHLRPASDVAAYDRLVETLRSSDQSQTVATKAIEQADPMEAPAGYLGELRERWIWMKDVHQFFGILRSLKLSRHQAISTVGEDYAWPLGGDSVAAMMQRSVDGQTPIMCFVESRGCIQIHSGPIHAVRPMGPWLNVMDPSFHLHLRLDHIVEAWAVRKPTSDGHVTSIEAYGADRQMIIQFFGQREEGSPERDEWRSLVESLPRARQTEAA
ncbi:MAG: hemin-degrading factor [Pseudaminobacter sp.]|nr:hemin-degrading factor [Pseudaminobacter sp.]